MASNIRVLIVDDQRRARRSLKALLATVPQVRAVLEAENGQEAVRLVTEAQPDVVVMDVRMPQMDGLEATRLIKAASPTTRVIVLTLYAEYREAALQVGADAFLTKGMASRKLLNAILISSSQGDRIANWDSCGGDQSESARS